MVFDVVLAVYAAGWVALGASLLLRALHRPALVVEEIALSVACVFPVGGALWLRAWLHGTPFLGFAAPWAWLTAAHFHVAGCGALVVAALVTRSLVDA